MFNVARCSTPACASGCSGMTPSPPNDGGSPARTAAKSVSAGSVPSADASGACSPKHAASTASICLSAVPRVSRTPLVGPVWRAACPNTLESATLAITNASCGYVSPIRRKILFSSSSFAALRCSRPAAKSSWPNVMHWYRFGAATRRAAGRPEETELVSRRGGARSELSPSSSSQTKHAVMRPRCSPA